MIKIVLGDYYFGGIKTFIMRVDSCNKKYRREKMAVSFNPGMNPDEYAKTYAAQNNMSVDDAKAELKSKYGDPDKNGSNVSGVSVFSSASGTTGASNEEDRAAAAMSNIDPNVFAQQFADQNGMTLDEAIADLEEKLGIPQEPTVTDFLKNIVGSIAHFLTGGEKVSDKPDPGVDPDTYAQTYADENGITLDEAKAQLKEKYGDPVKPDQEDETYDVEFGIDFDVDPDTYAQSYADAHGITLDEAKEELGKIHGEPTKPDATNETYDVEFGIDFKIGPDSYAQKYADRHGITLEKAKEELGLKYGTPKAQEEN